MDYVSYGYDGRGRTILPSEREEALRKAGQDPVRTSQDSPGSLVFQVNSLKGSLAGQKRVFSWPGHYETAEIALAQSRSAVQNALEILGAGKDLKVYFMGREITEQMKKAVEAEIERAKREPSRRSAWDRY